jgi:hypothetical protein
MENFDAIRAKAPAEKLADLIGLADGNDPALLEKLRRFVLEPTRTSQLAEKNAGRVADRVALRARLRERESARIGVYLAANPVRSP